MTGGVEPSATASAFGTRTSGTVPARDRDRARWARTAFWRTCRERRGGRAPGRGAADFYRVLWARRGRATGRDRTHCSSRAALQARCRTGRRCHRARGRGDRRIRRRSELELTPATGIRQTIADAAGGCAAYRFGDLARTSRCARNLESSRPTSGGRGTARRYLARQRVRCGIRRRPARRNRRFGGSQRALAISQAAWGPGVPLARTAPRRCF